VPFSTIRLEISLRPFRAVTAVIATCPDSSVPALVMNCLAPLIVQIPSASSARVWTLPASDPASGSVQPEGAELAARAEVGQQPLALLGVPKR
jgi:hypothetical protein